MEEIMDEAKVFANVSLDKDEDDDADSMTTVPPSTWQMIQFILTGIKEWS